VSSQIIETNPTSGSATTSSVRDNFGFAKTEINNLERMTEDRVVTTGDYDVQVANFTNDVTLAEGVRILIEIGSLSGGAGSANDTTTPTLNVDSTGAKTIVRQDGSALVAGDLKAGQYVDLIYDATATKWVWLNSPYAQLITSLKEEIAANVYPVGSIFTTTTNYSDASNGAAVTTALGMASTVQWSRYAQGRTIVGADLGTTINSASSSSNVVTLVVTSHGLSAGDSITVSGFTSDTDANGSFTVDSTTSTNIVYTASNVSDGSLTGSNLLVINNAFDAGDTGGASNHTLSQAEMNHNHQWHDSTSGTEDARIELTGDDNGKGSYDANADQVEFPNASSLFSDYYTDNNRNITGETVTPHNNLQPYITTYIWKRTA